MMLRMGMGGLFDMVNRYFKRGEEAKFRVLNPHTGRSIQFCICRIQVKALP